jgi:twinkle protein
MLSQIEAKAQELDELRKVRLLKPQAVDFTQYLKSTDHATKVREATAWTHEIREELENPVREQVCTMPWHKTHEGFQFRQGEVTVYAGSNGGGKSMITGQIALDLIRQRQKCCVMSFEMKPKRSIYRALRQFAGENIDSVMMGGRIEMMNSIIRRFDAFAGDNLWYYDQQGTVTSKQVIAVSRYCAMELGIQHVFIDSLMKCVPAEDDYNAQKYFVDELTALARDHNIHIHLVHHIRKLASEELQPGKNDIKGSGSIADQVDNVLMVWRNKKKEHEAQTKGYSDSLTPDAMLMCEKQRNGESEDWYKLWYHKNSQQFLESSDSVPMQFDHGGKF